MIKKLAVLLIYIIIISIIFFQQDIILAWVRQDHENVWLWLSVAAIVVGLVPIVPYGIIGGLIGAKYGAILGGFINVICSSISAIIIFLFVRYLFQEGGRRLLAKSKHVDAFTVWLESYPFFAILLGRMIPFIPAVIINSYTALSRVKLITFLVATFIGKLPVMLLFALVGSQLIDSPQRIFLTFAVYGLLISFVVVSFKVIEKKVIKHRKHKV